MRAKKSTDVEDTLSESKQKSKSIRKTLRSTKSQYDLRIKQDKELVCLKFPHPKQAEIESIDKISDCTSSQSTVSKECNNQSQPSTSESTFTNFKLPDQSKTEECTEKLPDKEQENTEIPLEKSDVTVSEEPESGNLETFGKIPDSQQCHISLSVINDDGIGTNEFADPSQPSTSEIHESMMELNSGSEMEIESNESDRIVSEEVLVSTIRCYNWSYRCERWTEEAKNVVYERFRDFIKRRKGPGLKRCSELIELEPELFKGRTAAQMNSLISNWIHGKSKMPTDDVHDSDDELTLYEFEEEDRARTSFIFPKRRWSPEAKELVITAFVDSIKKGVNPGHDKCRVLIWKNPSILEGRTPVQVNLLVDNWLRGKAEPPHDFLHLFPKLN